MDDLEQDFSATFARERGVSVVTVVGELDAASAGGLEAPLREAIDAGGGLVLDLLGCGFLDSTGLHAIIDAESAVAARGGRLAIACAAGGAVARTLEVALPGMLDLHERRDAAVAAVA
jgi:anti-sigma B factor antagonist